MKHQVTGSASHGGLVFDASFEAEQEGVKLDYIGKEWKVLGHTQDCVVSRGLAGKAAGRHRIGTGEWYFSGEVAVSGSGDTEDWWIGMIQSIRAGRREALYTAGRHYRVYQQAASLPVIDGGGESGGSLFYNNSEKLKIGTNSVDDSDGPIFDFPSKDVLRATEATEFVTILAAVHVVRKEIVALGGVGWGLHYEVDFLTEGAVKIQARTIFRRIPAFGLLNDRCLPGGDRVGDGTINAKKNQVIDPSPGVSLPGDEVPAAAAAAALP